MYYQENKSLTDATIDSLELLMCNGKVKKLRVNGQIHSTKPATILITIMQQEIDKPTKIQKDHQRW